MAAYVKRQQPLGERATGGVNGAVHVKQQLMQRLGPGLLVIVPDSRQFPQVVGIAQGT